MSIYFTELAVILLLIFILFGPNLILEIINFPVIKGVKKPNKVINKPSKKVVKEKKDNSNNHSNEE